MAIKRMAQEAVIMGGRAAEVDISFRELVN